MGFSGTFDLADTRDDAVRLVGDLRLDNREELLARLDGPTRDSPDAELALAAYLRWGEACPRHLLGDFAFALWDGRRRRLLLARDPLGVKPLHYAQAGPLFVVASEAQQVLRHPAVPRRLDEIAVADYLAGHAGEPERTFFRDVQRLPAAHLLAATLETVKIERFWSLPEARILYRRDDDYTDRFLELFRRSVADRLRTASGSAGVLMSGGLDSCSVAAVAHGALAGQDGTPRLFAGSFVFDRLGRCDEREHIRATASHLGLETELVPAERFPVFAGSEALLPALEEPFTVWDGCFQEMLRQVRRRGAGVLLTGHGSDDLLAGSVLIYADRLRRGDLAPLLEVGRYAAGRGRAWRWVLYNYLARPLLPAGLDRMIGRVTRSAPEPGLPDWIDKSFIQRTGLLERHPSAPQFPATARHAIHERFLQTHWEGTVRWYDRHAHQQGVAVRHPFLDRLLVEFLASIPPDQLFRAGSYKPFLRRAMKGLLPETVRLRPTKTEFKSFLDLSLRASDAAVAPLLKASAVSRLGFVDIERLRSAYHQFRNGMPGSSLWYAFALEAWLRQHGTILGLSTSALGNRSAA